MRRIRHLSTGLGLACFMACASASAAPRTGSDPASDIDPASIESEGSASDRASAAAEARSKPSATRNAKPAATRSAKGARNGDAATPVRSPGAKWHSFLPGMFR